MSPTRLLAILFLFACAALPLYADAADDAVRAGWQALDAQRLEVAQAAFQKALRLRPGHADAEFGLGYALVRLCDGRAAIPHLARARDLRCPRPDLDLELGRAYFLCQQFADAVGPLERYRRNQPEAWQTYELLGLTHFALHDYARAREAFSSPTLDARSERRPMYLYYLGAASAAQGDEERAVGYLDELLRDYPDSVFARDVREGPLPPGASPAAATAAAQAPAAAAPAESRPDAWAIDRSRPARPWYLFAGGELNQDTNPLSLGDDTLVPLSLARRESLTFQAQVGGGVQWIRNAQAVSGLELRQAKSWHDDLARFDQDRTALLAYGEYWITESVGVGADVRAEWLWVDGDRTRTSWGPGGELFLVEADWMRTRLRYGHLQEQYLLDDLPGAQDLDARDHSVALTQELRPRESALRFSLAYRHRFHDADGRDYDADVDGISLDAGVALPWQIDLAVSLAWQHGDFHHGNSLDPSDRERDDDTWIAALRVARPIAPWITVFAGATWIDNDSNVAAFDYERVLYGGGFEARY